MILQPIVFPREDICKEWKMYFRSAIPKGYEGEIDDRNDDEVVLRAMRRNNNLSKGEITYNNKESIKITAHHKLSLETYFNAFSIGKWSKYTTVDNVSIVLNIKGDAMVKMYHVKGAVDDFVNDPKCNGGFMNAQKYNGLHVNRSCIDDECEIVREKDKYIVHVNKMYNEGVIYPVIMAQSDIEFTGGRYETTALPAQEVDIALGICTFKREAFVKSNVGKIINEIINNDKCELQKHLEVYISDNGQTLTNEDFSSNSKVHLFPNMNAGGAGGFTRAMIEAMMRRENSKFSHMILMDDDIVLDCRVIVRTYYLLRYLKGEYKKAMIGGSMFELDYRFLQFEAGATFGGIEVKFYNKNWDMRFRNTVACNEVEQPINYSGWWYNVIPATVIREDNLPIPLFIHYDDIEYGIRNDKNGTILINGICVWHPQGANKAPISMNYYDVRNMLIANVGRPDEMSAAELIYHMKNRVIGDVIRYRYSGAERVFEAIDDFYKGPEYFMALNPVENHKRLMSGNYQFYTPEELDVNMDKISNVKDDDIPRWWYVWDAFCWALPARDKVRISTIRDHGLPFMAKSIYFYDDAKGAGYFVTRDYKKAIELFFRFFKTTVKIIFRHYLTMRRWNYAKKSYTSREYWERYLDI